MSSHHLLTIWSLITAEWNSNYDNYLAQERISPVSILHVLVILVNDVHISMSQEQQRQHFWPLQSLDMKKSAHSNLTTCTKIWFKGDVLKVRMSYVMINLDETSKERLLEVLGIAKLLIHFCVDAARSVRHFNGMKTKSDILLSNLGPTSLSHLFCNV